MRATTFQLEMFSLNQYLFLFLRIFEIIGSKMVIFKKVDDWVVRPGVAMATKMKNLTRIFKSYNSMTANDIESNFQKDN